ncbi:hypothetical protein ABK040_005478 [Willaertia magna]
MNSNSIHKNNISIKSLQMSSHTLITVPFIPCINADSDLSKSITLPSTTINDNSSQELNTVLSPFNTIPSSLLNKKRLSIPSPTSSIEESNNSTNSSTDKVNNNNNSDDNNSNCNNLSILKRSSKEVNKKRKTRCCRNIQKQELIKYFSFKEEKAAELMGISKSKLKRVKKELGITRWPHRRLESLSAELQEVKTQLSQLEQMSRDEKEKVDKLSYKLNIIQGSIDMINNIPNIITKLSNNSIKELVSKNLRIKICNLLNP